MHHRFAHELQGGAEDGGLSVSADARSQSPTTTTTATGASSSQSPDIEATSSTNAPKRKRHWGSNRPVKADPPTKKKQRGSSGTATPAATKTTRAAARAIAAGASKAGSPQGEEASGEEDSAAGSDEGEDDDYDDEAFEMNDHIGEPNESRASAIQSAYQPHGVAFESTHTATSPSGKRRFSDPVRLRNGALQQQQQQQHHQQQQQQAMMQRSALPNSYMRGGHPAAMMMGYAPMSAPPWHQHQHSGPAMQSLPAMRGAAMSSMDTRGYDGGASQHAAGHGTVSTSSSSEQEAQSHRRLQLLATVSAVSQ